MGALEASPRASGSALEARWARLERHLGVQEVTLRGDFELKMKIDSGNADFLKSMLSPRREHRFGGREGSKMEPRMLPKGPCEAQRDPEERHAASDDARSALSESLEWRTLAHCRQRARNRWCAHIRALQRARGRALVQADGPDAFQLHSACSFACAAVLAMGSLSRPANR